jgi:multicomponent Na+:H+ antiporter subunit D
MYLRPATKECLQVKEAPVSLLLPMWTLVLANIYFGINTELTINIADTAVQLLGITDHHE